MNGAAALDAAQRAGLSPRGRGRGVRIYCPSCQGPQGGRADRKASVCDSTGVWHCFACTARGDAAGLARAAGVTVDVHAVHKTSPASPQGRAPHPDDVRAWCRELAALPERGPALARWAREVRGWPVEVADRVHTVHGLSWCPDYVDAPRWARRTRQGRPVVLALSDELGIWTAEARVGSAGVVDGPKALRLSTRDVDRGRLAAFGSIPGAVDAAVATGRPLLIVEGGPDYIAAAALGWPVIGAHGHHGLVKVADAVRAAVIRKGCSPQSLAVVLVPHRGDSGDVGVLSALAAADVLAGSAKVRVADVLLDRGDLADLLRDRGADAVRVAVDDAEERHGAPWHVDDAGAGAMLRAAFRAAVDGAAGKLPVLAVPAGAGKTWAAGIEGCKLASLGPSVIIGVPTLALAHEKADEARTNIAADLAPAVEVRVAAGQVATCHLVRDEADDDIREGMVRGMLVLGRRACDGCPLASRQGGACDGWRPISAPRGVVTFATHAAVARTDRPDVLVLDELPALVSTVETTPEHLRSLAEGALAARSWRRSHPAHGAFAVRLAGALDALPAPATHAWRADVRGMLAALDPDALAVLSELAAAVLAEGDVPPLPSPQAVRQGAARHWPDVAAWSFVRDVAAELDRAPGRDAVVSSDEGAKSHESRASASFGVRRDQAGWVIETRTPWTLPTSTRGGVVVALDATARESEAEWAALAAGAELVPELVPIHMAGHGARGVHYQTTRLTTRHLFARVGRRVAFYVDAPGAVRNALMRACGETPCSVGVLTHSALAEVLRWGVSLDADAAAPAPRCLMPEHEHARTIADDVARLVRRGWTFTVGHYGAHERGSNAFLGVDALVLMGSPRPDLGATVADAAVLGLDALALFRSRRDASAGQGLARARHLRRAGVRLVYAADDAPPIMAGVAWTVEAADQAHAPTTPAALGARRIVAALADRWGALDVGAVAEVMRRVDLGEKATDARVREVAASLGWRRWPVHTGSAGRPRMVYAAELADAAWGSQGARLELSHPAELLAALGLVVVVDGAELAAEVAGRDAVVSSDEGAKSHESRASASFGVRRDQAGWVIETRTPEPEAVARAGPRVASG